MRLFYCGRHPVHPEITVACPHSLLCGVGKITRNLWIFLVYRSIHIDTFFHGNLDIFPRAASYLPVATLFAPNTPTLRKYSRSRRRPDSRCTQCHIPCCSVQPIVEVSRHPFMAACSLRLCDSRQCRPAAYYATKNNCSAAFLGHTRHTHSAASNAPPRHSVAYHKMVDLWVD